MRCWRASVSLTALEFSLERSSASAEVSCRALVIKGSKFFLLYWTKQHFNLWGACFSGTVWWSWIFLYCKPCRHHWMLALEFLLLKVGGGWYLCCPAAMAASGYSCMISWLISVLSLLRKSLIFIILIAFHEVIMLLHILLNFMNEEMFCNSLVSDV